ncbi:MAG: hypothetical protein AAB586_01405 [Patescibacteria group bacterium]
MTIGFDLDDVLLDFRESLHRYHNYRFGTDYKRHQFRENLAEMWNCTEEESKKKVFGFYQSSEHRNAEPINGAVEKIKKLKQHHILHVITAKPEELKNISLEWLDKHFPQTFAGIHFTNQYQYQEKGLKRTKGEVCKELGVEFFVDDSLHNVNDIASFGIPALLFDAPWNQGEIKPPIHRVYSWDEIVEILIEN